MPAKGFRGLVEAGAAAAPSKAAGLLHPKTATGTLQSALGLAAAQLGLPVGVTVASLEFSEPALEDITEDAVPLVDGVRFCSAAAAQTRENPENRTALERPCLTEDLGSMGSLGSPFDAPLPRFHQAAAHLSNSLGASSSKKPPLSPSLPESKSLKAYDERQERQTLADFSQSKSLERSSSFTRRRYSRTDLNFSQANSLASVVENSMEADLATLPSSSTPEPLLVKSTSINPATYLISSPARSFFSQRLPGLLAATGMLLLLIMSVIALWPPPNGAHTVPRVQATPDQASLPQRIFTKLFGGAGGGPLHMEHFTAAQAAGKSNVGFGLENANTATDQAHPAHDFERFVSTHLGFEPEKDFSTQEGQSRADFVAAYQSAEAMNGNQPAQSVVYGGGTGAMVSDGQAQMNAGKPSIEGRKELEADPTNAAPVNSGSMGTGSNGGVNGATQLGTEQTGISSASLNAETNTDAAKKKRVGVIPQESILPAGSNPLANSNGVPDPRNVKGAVTSGVATSGNTNTGGQLSSSGSASTLGTVSGGSTSAGTATPSGSSGAVVTNSNSMAGRIAVQPNTGGGINSAAGTKTSSTAGSTTGSTAGSSASSLRRGSTGQIRGAGTTAGETTPLDTMSNGQVTSVAASELSSTQQTGSQRSGLVTTSMGGSFTPLTGRKLLRAQR